MIRGSVPALLALLAVGCDRELSPATQVVVAVSSTLEIAPRLVELQVLDESGEKEGSTEEVTVSGRRFPISFGVVPRRGRDRDAILLVARAKDSSGNVRAEAKGRVTFVPRKSLAVELWFMEECRAIICSALETCGAEGSLAGSCGPIPTSQPRETAPGAELDTTSPPAVVAAPTPEREAQPDGLDGGGSEPPPAGAGTGDPSTSHAGDSGTVAEGDAALAQAGASCTRPNSRACDGHNGRLKLLCFGGMWIPNGSCDANTRCETRRDSAEVGVCRPVVDGCADKLPGDDVCDGATRRTCGVDLLDYGSKPCPAHASCNDTEDVSCQCEAPYLDDGQGGCATAACIAMPCMNGGVCTSSSTTRTCDCSQVDFKGQNCEIKVDDCAVNPCAHGTCVDGVRSRTCDCRGVDYQGPSCETKIDDCVLNACAHGTCADGLRSRVCDCSSVDYQGQSCESQIDDCALRPCAHGGACTDGTRTRSCACPTGFAGDDCSQNINECAAANVCSGSTNSIPFSYPCVDSGEDTAGYRCRGQFPDWRLPAPTTRFTVASGVVSDSHTGLRWQQAIDSELYVSWADARSYCARLSLAPGGWRLPTVVELLSIVDYSRTNPAINTDVFRDSATYVWTDTEAVAQSGAWFVYFFSGYLGITDKTITYRVRCVR